MTRSETKKFPRLEDLVIISLIIHIVLFIILPLLLGLSWKKPRIAPVYYVDLVNVPVANPQRGGATSEEQSEKAPVAPPPPKTVRMPEAKQQPKKTRNDQAKEKENDRDFSERLAKLAESQRQETALNQLRNRAASTKQPKGMPSSSGSEAGSDYAAFVQSRLKDAFVQTIAMQSKNPEVIVRISISRTGKIKGYRIERTSGDRLFENAVAHAIQIAGRNIPPPPTDREFEGGFVFRPQGGRVETLNSK